METSKFDKFLSTNRVVYVYSSRNFSSASIFSAYDEKFDLEQLVRRVRTKENDTTLAKDHTCASGSSLPLAANFSPLREYSRSRKQRGSLIPVIIGVALENSE